jgi:hypothetical protein
MDWHKLQHKLFEIDPSDLKSDLAKLQAAAQGSAQPTPQPTVDYLNESAKVPEGSLTLDKDYSVSDFAALAGIKLPVNEDLKSAWQSGVKNYNNPAGVIGGVNAMSGDVETPGGKIKDIEPKVKAKKPVAASGILDPELEKKLAPYSEQLQAILSKPKHKAAFEDFLNRYSPKKEAQKVPTLKPRDPNAQFMQDLRKSGAMGAHKDKKKDEKSGKVKHKGKQFESIKDMLYAKLAEKK